MSRKIYKDFVMIESGDANEFRNEVNRFIDAGYDFHGDPQVFVVPLSRNDCRVSYNQAMVLRSEPAAPPEGSKGAE